MIIFTKKQDETNYIHYNIEYILHNINNELIQKLIYDTNAELHVIGNIHKTQYIHGIDYPWFNIKGYINNVEVLFTAHVYVCYKQNYLYYNQEYQSDCLFIDEEIPNVDLNTGYWVFQGITF